MHPVCEMCVSARDMDANRNNFYCAQCGLRTTFIDAERALPFCSQKCLDERRALETPKPVDNDEL